MPSAGWGEWSGNQRPQQNQIQQPQQQQAPAGPPPPPMQMAYGQQASTQPVGQTQPGPQPPGQNQAAVNNFNQAFQNFAKNPDWMDTDRSPAQWEAWRQQESNLRARGGGAQGCPPDKPFTGRNGQCAFKPDDCPDGMHVEGSDTNGSAHCVPNGQGQQAPGMFAGPPMPGGFGGGQQTYQPPVNQNKLLGDTYAPGLGYFGQLGQMNGSGQGGLNMQALGPMIQSLLGIQLG